MSAVIGFDVGQRKIGVAVGQTETQMAFVRPAILVDDIHQAWPLIEALVAAESPTAIVVGWPRNMDGTAGPQADQVTVFVDELKRRINIPVSLRDERLTTEAVQHEQIGRPLTRGQEDSLAAQLLLESYLRETHADA